MKKSSSIGMALALVASAMLSFGCASNSAAPSTAYAVTVSQVAGAEITVQPQQTSRGFDGFTVTLSNTGDSDMQLLWTKSSFQYDGKTQRVFVQDQDITTIDLGARPLVVAAHKQQSQLVYSAEQVVIRQSPQSYSPNGSSDDSDDFEAASTIEFEPLRADSVTINLVLRVDDNEQMATVTIAPAGAAPTAPVTTSAPESAVTAEPVVAPAAPAETAPETEPAASDDVVEAASETETLGDYSVEAAATEADSAE